MNKGLKIGIISIVVIIILIITYFLLKKSGKIEGKDDCCLFDKNNVCIAKRGDAKCETTSLKK